MRKCYLVPVPAYHELKGHPWTWACITADHDPAKPIILAYGMITLARSALQLSRCTNNKKEDGSPPAQALIGRISVNACDIG